MEGNAKYVGRIWQCSFCKINLSHGIVKCVQLQVTDGLDWHNPEVTFEEVRSQAWVKVKYHSQVEIKQIVINNEWNKSNNSKVAGFVCLQVSCSSGDFGDWEGDCYCPGQGNWLTAAGFSTLCCIILCWFKLLYYIHANPTIGHFSLELFRCDSID